MAQYQEDTIIAPITPAIGGTVALVRISGPQAIPWTDRFLRTKKSLSALPGNTFVYGTLVDEKGEAIDEVIVSLYRKPHSYTGEDSVEISSHANPFIVQEIIDLFLRQGCRYAEPGEFTRRAFLNNKMDLVQAEAVADLIAARSRMAAKQSLKQLKGGVSDSIKRLKERLIHTKSLVELDLDFTEEDLEIIPREQVVKNLQEIKKEINTLLASYQKSVLLKKGLEVLITGKPNVGKSSLMNRLLEKQRVIVSSIPGTTRDAIHDETVIHQTVVRFIDTAGFRTTSNAIEYEGMEMARDYFDQVQQILLVVDGSSDLTEEDKNLIKILKTTEKEKVLGVINKSDLPQKEQAAQYLTTHKIPFLTVSARTGAGIAQLKERIINKFYQDLGEESEELTLSSERQKQKLEQALAAIEETIQNVQGDLGYEFVAEDLSRALDALKEITGEIHPEAVLNHIFSQFCIGK